MATSPPGSLIRYRDMVVPRCAMNCGEPKQRSAPQSCEDGKKDAQALGDALASGQELIGDGVRMHGHDDDMHAVVLPQLAGIGSSEGIRVSPEVRGRHAALHVPVPSTPPLL